MSRKLDRLLNILVLVSLAALASTYFYLDSGSGGRAGDPPVEPSATAPAETRPASATRPADAWTPPDPPAASQRRLERRRMVDRQLVHPPDRRDPITDPKVLEIMRTVPRHVFVPADVQRLAYRDSALSIGYGQTISQPYIVALMTELLDLTPESRVLEIGTGSGYQAAVLAHLTPHVYTIEIVEPLGERAQRVLAEQGYDDVRVRIGDGYKGWPEAAPFDAIIVTCAAEDLPEPLWEQLAPGGRIVIPTGSPGSTQELVVIRKTSDGRRETKTVTYVQFVPLIREREE